MKKKKLKEKLAIQYWDRYQQGFKAGYEAKERGEHHQWFSTSDSMMQTVELSNTEEPPSEDLHPLYP